MTKNRTPTPVYLDPGMHSGLEVKGLCNPADERVYNMCLWFIIRVCGLKCLFFVIRVYYL